MNNTKTIKNLISEFVSMSQKGVVCFDEETAYHKIIDFYEIEFEYYDALDVIEHGLVQFPNSFDLLKKKANLEILLGETEDAWMSLNMAEKLNSYDIDIQILKVQLYQFEGEYEKALELIDSLELEVDGVEYRIKILEVKARIFEEMGENDDEFYALQDLLRLDPKNTDALEKMWLTVELTGKYKESIRLHKEIIDKDPYSYFGWYNLGHAYSFFSRHKKAVEAFEFAYIINEDFEFAYRDCAEELMKLGKYLKALKCYNEALHRFKPDSDILTKVGHCLLSLNNKKKAIRWFNKAITIDNKNHEAFYNMGLCHFEETNWNESLKSFTKANILNPLREEYILGMADSFYHLGDFEKADEYYKKACETAPELNIYWIRYSNFLMEIENYEKALSVLNEASTFSFGAEIDYAKAALLLLTDKKKDAFEPLEKGLIANHESHNLLFELYPNAKEDKEVLAAIKYFAKGM